MGIVWETSVSDADIYEIAFVEPEPIRDLLQNRIDMAIAVIFAIFRDGNDPLDISLGHA